MRSRVISAFSTDTLGVAIYANGVLTDPNDDVVTVTVKNSAGTPTISNGVATKAGVGLYEFTLSSVDTRLKDEYTIEWDYLLGGTPNEFIDKFEVVEPMPFWDALNDNQHQSVYNIYYKLSSSYDSKEGGPYLWEVAQADFNAYEVISRLMCTDAITYINFSRPPAIDPPFSVIQTNPNVPIKVFPDNWLGLLERATYVETLRHIARSYLEQPDVENTNAVRMDRRKYYTLWTGEANREQVILDKMLAMFKRKYLFTGRSMLIAGGLFQFLYWDPSRPRWLYSSTSSGNTI